MLAYNECEFTKELVRLKQRLMHGSLDIWSIRDVSFTQWNARALNRIATLILRKHRSTHRQVRSRFRIEGILKALVINRLT